MKDKELNKKEDLFRQILKKIHFEATMEGILPNNAKTNIVLSRNAITASWSYMPPHKITFGLNKTNLRQTPEIIKSLFYHEVSHGLFTNPNKTLISDALKEKNTSFKLLNLFEDARIEHLFRVKTNRKFNWAKSKEYGFINKNIISPENIFYSFIKSEGNKEESVFYSIINKKTNKSNTNNFDMANEKIEDISNTICNETFSTDDVEYINGVKTIRYKNIYSDDNLENNENVVINFLGFQRERSFLQPIFECNGVFYSSGTACAIVSSILLENNITYIEVKNHVVSKFGNSFSWKKGKELLICNKETKFPHGSIILEIEKFGKRENIQFISYESNTTPKNPFVILKSKEERYKILKERFGIVYDYYLKVIKAVNTEALIDIAVEWNKEFQNEDIEISKTVMETLEHNPINKDPLNIGEDITEPNIAKDFKGIDLDGEEVDQYGDTKNGSTNSTNTGGGANITSIKKAREIKLLDEKNQFQYSKSQIIDISKAFLNILSSRFEKYNSYIPSKKINIKRISIASQKFFINKRDTLKGKDNLVLIVDCSASMKNSHIYNAKILILVLNSLNEKGLINGSIVLTNDRGSLTLPLPVEEDIVKEINCAGSEGFATTVNHIAPLLIKATKIFVFTDACFGDVPDRNYKKRIGKSIYGLYVGEKDMSRIMKPYFDVSISKKSLLEIVNEIVKEIV